MVAMLLLMMPVRHFAQNLLTATQPTVEFNITDIANFDERVFFLYK